MNQAIKTTATKRVPWTTRLARQRRADRDIGHACFLAVIELALLCGLHDFELDLDEHWSIEVRDELTREAELGIVTDRIQETLIFARWHGSAVGLFTANLDRFVGPDRHQMRASFLATLGRFRKALAELDARFVESEVP